MQIQSLVFNNFVPSAGQEVESYLKQFSAQARNLTGVGIVFLGITAILMLKNIEKTFNSIWNTRENRSGLSSFLLYWAILSLGPIFIGLALAISTYLVSLKVFFNQVDVIGIGPHLLRLTPYLLTSAAFTLIFAAVPNCRVPIKQALIGGLITALVFEIAKQLFTSLVSNTSYQLIYGTFAAIPLFLLWIYLSWLIVLAGAELVYALSGFNLEGDEEFSDGILSLAVLELLWHKHQTGESVPERELIKRPWLFGKYSMSADRWIGIRDILFSAGLIRTDHKGRFILGKDLHQFTLWDLTCLLGHETPLDKPIYQQDLPWLQQSVAKLQQAQRDNKSTLSIPLAELFNSQKTEADADSASTTDPVSNH